MDQRPLVESTRSTFPITEMCPEVGEEEEEEEEESVAYIAIATYTPSRKHSYIRMCIHHTYLSLYLSISAPL